MTCSLTLFENAKSSGLSAAMMPIEITVIPAFVRAVMAVSRLMGSVREVELSVTRTNTREDRDGLSKLKMAVD